VLETTDLGYWKNFWRIRGIVSLVGYPEKTDRLEQRQAAGKTPWPLFDFVGHRLLFRFVSNLWQDRILLLIDPPATFSLSSRGATCYFVCADARD